MKRAKTIPTPSTPTDPKGGEHCNGQAPVVREMSLAKAKALIRKTSILHEGLFRRLAK